MLKFLYLRAALTLISVNENAWSKISDFIGGAGGSCRAQIRPVMRACRFPPDHPVEKNECRADQDESRGKCRAVSRMQCLQLIGTDAGFIQPRFADISGSREV